MTAGTILEGTKLPPRIWFQAAWLVTNEKLGMSAPSLQRALGLARYDTSWLLLHKLRRAMVRPGGDLLSGEIEVDETHVGAPAPADRAGAHDAWRVERSGNVDSPGDVLFGAAVGDGVDGVRAF